MASRVASLQFCTVASITSEDPAGSFIAGDNEIGLALIMTIPLLRYLQLTAKAAWLRGAIGIAMVLCAISAVGSQSRGALLGIDLDGDIPLVEKSQQDLYGDDYRRLRLGLSCRSCHSNGLIEWKRLRPTNRMARPWAALTHGVWPSIWRRTGHSAADSTRSVRKCSLLYTGSAENVHDSHSIYFEVLGEHGFVGLALFLLLGFLTWRTASKVVKRARSDPQNGWLADLASMIQVSLVGYASAGAFLGLAYFDFYYTLVAVVVVCSRLLVPQEQAREPGLVGGGVLQGESTGGRVTT